MARARNIKPAFFSNDQLADIHPLGRLLFIGLWTIADREGRLEDRPKRIKAEVLPYDDCNVDSLLNALDEHEFILRYESGGRRYIQILAFKKHQNPHTKESESTIPAPCKHSTSTVQEQGKAQPLPEQAGLIPDSLLLIPDSGLPSTDLSSAPPPADSHPPEAFPSSEKSKAGTRLPDDWVLPKDWGNWALTEKPSWTQNNVRKEAEKFRDHWHANANRKEGRKADWQAAWRNWVRNCRDAQNVRASPQLKSQKTDQWIAEITGQGAESDKRIIDIN